MDFKRIHQDVQLPVRASDSAGGLDIMMPTAGRVRARENASVPTHSIVQLGFAAKVPDGHVALILPRSGAGAKHGVQLRNTVGVIDSDYTGEWAVAVSQREGADLEWSAGERLFQFIVVPVAVVEVNEVEELPKTERGAGGFGSTGSAEVKTPARVTSDEPVSLPEGGEKTPAKPVKVAEAAKVDQPAAVEEKPAVDTPAEQK